MSAAIRRRSRTRRVLKWIGTLLCALVCAAFAVSLRYTFVFELRRDLGVAQRAGIIMFRWPHPNMPRGGSPRLDVITLRTPPLVFWMPRYRAPKDHGPLPMVSSMSRYTGGSLSIPHWLILLVLAIPTVMFWQADRPKPEGRCAGCGYDLTGNVSGICPECGTPVKREGKPR